MRRRQLTYVEGSSIPTDNKIKWCGLVQRLRTFQSKACIILKKEEPPKIIDVNIVGK